MLTRKKEIRQILLGYISFEGKSIAAAEGVLRMRSLGVFNNSGEARLFGVAERTRRYSVPKNQREKLGAVCEKAFLNIGRSVVLHSDAACPAVLHTSYFFNPSVLTAESEKKDVLTIRVYTARTLSMFFTVSHAFRVLEKQLPEGFVRKPSEKLKKKANTKGKKPEQDKKKSPESADGVPDSGKEK